MEVEFVERQERSFFDLEIKEEHYGVLLKYIRDVNVTDINWNGTQLWIDDVTKGRYLSESVLTIKFIEEFSRRVGDMVNKSFNPGEPILEAESKDLRFSILHPVITDGFYSLSIRKTPPVLRIDTEKLVESGYCSSGVDDLMRCFVEAHFNICVVGNPGAGKTEYVKRLTKFIKPYERTITIEDSFELRFKEINPENDCVSLKVGPNLTYTQAIKAAMRQFPKWLIQSEARSVEVKSLLEAFSTGVNGITTAHTNAVEKIPGRFVSMSQDGGEALLNEVYEHLDVGVLVSSIIKDGKIERKISEIGLFWRTLEGKNIFQLLYKDGEFLSQSLPKHILKRFQSFGVKAPTLQ